MRSGSTFLLLLRLMAYEEWRLHATLFDGSRFALLPVLLAGLTTVAAGTLTLLGVGFPTLLAGSLALAFLFGLQTGTIGFESRDGMENILGEATLLLYSVRTLPLSKRGTVAAFLIKDMAYYAILFISPVVAGTYFGYQLTSLLAGSMFGVACGSCSTSVGMLASLGLVAQSWVASVLVFLFGVSLSLVASGEVARNLRLALGGGILIGVVAVVSGLPTGLSSLSTVRPIVMPPFTSSHLLGLTGATLVMSLIGIYRFSPTGATAETHPRNEFNWVARRLGGGHTASLAAKTVMDVHRSSGGVGKLLVSSAMLLTAVYAVLEVLKQWIALAISPGIVFSTLLSVTAVPTYIWLTQLDDASTYRFYPVDVRTLFTAKALAFVLLETPVALTYYAFVSVTLRPTLVDLVVGGAVLVGALAYLFGITVYLTGFSPNEALFDADVFLRFTLAGMVALVPFLIVGFFVPTITGVTVAGVLLGALLLGVVGVGVYRRGATLWADRLTLAVEK